MQEFCSIESDMQPYEIDLKILVEKTFAENPLLGNEILSEKRKESLYTITKKYINQRLRDPQIEFTLSAPAFGNILRRSSVTEMR